MTHAKPIKFLGLTLPHRHTSYSLDGSVSRTYFDSHEDDSNSITVLIDEGPHGISCSVSAYTGEHYVDLVEVRGHATAEAARAAAVRVCRSVFKLLAAADGYEVTS